MAIRLQVSCINKRGNHYDPHERILNIGGISGIQRWKYSQSQAISYIENRTYSFFVNAGGYTTDVIVATHMGNKYLKTNPDATGKDNLLALPECP
jgi:hypothetical protein